MIKGSNLDNISERLELALQKEGIPGAVALVTDKKSILYHAAFGWENVAAAKRMRPDSLFNIASMTKAVTSFGVMQLVDKGLIALDDPIRNHIRDLCPFEVFTDFSETSGKYEKRPATTEVSIKHLLTHTSGLAYWFNSAQLYHLGKEKTIHQSWRYPLHHDPGTLWTYGDSTALLGELIALKAGQSIEAYMEDNIFNPLGMTETSFSLSPKKTEGLVTLHKRTGKGFSETPNPREIVAKGYGDAGLISTASDYAKFMRVFLNEGKTASGECILRPDLVAQMGENHIGDLDLRLQVSTDPTSAKDFPQGAGQDRWGLGFQIAAQNKNVRRAKGSLSWAGLFNTKFWIDPQNGIAATLLMQYLPFDDESNLRVLDVFEASVYQSLTGSGLHQF